jgi:probable rRNA maturation factor
MTYRVEIVSETREPDLTDLLRRAGRACLAFEQAPDGALSVVLADEPTAKELNLRFRGLDEATDVLSFSDGSIQPDDKGIYFGDVVICRPVAERQAKAAQHPQESELALLTIHGILHLLGYDHATEIEKRAMWASQSSVLKQLGLRVKVPG